MGNQSQGVTIDAVVHTSLFEHLMTRGSVGIEVYGKMNTTTILALRTGVIFDGIQHPAAFVSNPFASFAVAYDYQFHFPMFSMVTGDDYSHSSDDAGIRGVAESQCRWGNESASNESAADATAAA
ncbi:hypotheical conserved protein [Halarchaeum acidiphilum MH1-52-1]|uniref:Hypotheical conserved protein n=2 Tax=Halarchaeum acidiphilum TaxID=489138 RepID=U2YSF6_9EURY|nr:hypotheical conserved protein [Halarchaeum acidiphilum MH1-52-1]